MRNFTRRDFLKTGLTAAAMAGAGTLPLKAARGTATDWVTLGKSGVKVTRLALGTGSIAGRVQRAMGQENFTSMVRYAYDQGIRFFETAESYSDMHRMLGIALKGIPRDSYRLMSKITTHGDVDPMDKIDELRKLANTDYFDIMLLHWQHEGSWPTDSQRWQDGIMEAQHKQAVVSHGASVHGLPALRRVPDMNWLQVAMIRMNHKGVAMDAEDYMTQGLGNVPEVVQHVEEARKAGMGVISMKLVGEGRFTDREDRKAAMRFAFRHAGVDCVTVGYKSTAEVDEAIQRMNSALANAESRCVSRSASSNRASASWVRRRHLKGGVCPTRFGESEFNSCRVFAGLFRVASPLSDSLQASRTTQEWRFFPAALWRDRNRRERLRAGRPVRRYAQRHTNNSIRVHPS